MKKKITTVTLIVLMSICVFSIVVGLSEERRVLGELFTSTTCPPCAGANDHLDEIMDRLVDDMVLVRYHVWYPSSGDPFYDANPSPNRARHDYYGTEAVPTMYVDGSVGSAYSFEGSVASRGAVPSPIEIDLIVRGVSSDVASIDVTITPDDETIDLNAKLFVMITEDEIYYSAPNGQTVFYQVFRKMGTVNAGMDVHLSYGETVEEHFDINVDSDEWDLEKCHLVAFVQNPTTKEILQSQVCDLYVPAEYAFTFSGGNIFGAITEPIENASFNLNLSNTGTRGDEYDIWLRAFYPPDWSISLSGAGVDSVDSLHFSLLAFDDVDFTLNVVPGMTPANINIQVIIYSNELGTYDTLEYAVSNPQDILLVNASGESIRGEFYKRKLDALGKQYSYWDIDLFGEVPNFNDAGFQTIIWFTGDKSNLSNHLSSIHRSNLRTYLNDEAGKLLISGNKLGAFTRSDYNFYFVTLGAGYNSAIEDVTYIGDVYGNPVINSASFSLDSVDCEVIYAFAGAPNSELFLRHHDYTGAGVVNELSGGGRVVYTSFAIEDITNDASLIRLLEHTFNYLETGNNIKENSKNLLPATSSISNVYPTPFNSSVAFTVDLIKDSSVRIDITDINGKCIDAIIDGEKSSGTHNFIWSPIANIPSGIYMISLHVDGTLVSSKKVVYAK